MFITAAHAAEAASGKASFPPFDATFFVPQLIWLAVVFGLLYWLMSKIALPRVAEILETRRARIEGDLATAAQAQKSADEAAAGYEKTLADAKAKAQASAQATRNQISAETDSRRKALEEGLNAKISAAEEQIGKMKAEAMANVAGIAQEAAGDIVKQLTGRAPDAATVSAALAALKK